MSRLNAIERWIPPVKVAIREIKRELGYSPTITEIGELLNCNRTTIMRTIKLGIELGVFRPRKKGSPRSYAIK